jgi:hypothetical protein
MDLILKLFSFSFQKAGDLAEQYGGAGARDLVKEKLILR